MCSIVPSYSMTRRPSSPWYSNEYAHDLLRLRRFGETGEAAQIKVHHRNLGATRSERVVRLARHDQITDFRREKSRKPRIPPDLGYLLSNPRFESCIPFRKLCRLFLHLSVLVLDLGIKAFEYSILLPPACSLPQFAALPRRAPVQPAFPV